jgi:16S rRNA (cytosine967-C5)-methyltransferase
LQFGAADAIVSPPHPRTQPIAVKKSQGTKHGPNQAQSARPPHTARCLAAVVIERVTDDAAFASRALDGELKRAQLDGRDAALATEIVYGTLRVLPVLDQRIAQVLTRADARMDSFARATLRTATYQLDHLSRLPTHAIVDECVSQVRERRGPKLAGFVNAVLRKLAGTRPADPKPASALALPSWVQESLLQALGPDRLARLLEQHASTPALCLRADRVARSELQAQLIAAQPNAQVQVTSLSPLGLNLRRSGSPRALPGFKDGAFSVQEEGAQLIALAIDAQPGERIADVCAGHGGKTTLLARQVGSEGSLCAIDQDERKLQAIPGELARIGLASVAIELHPVDLSVGTGGLPAHFDRVLVDAPCTGLGTVLRRPELLLRLRPEDPARMSQLQLKILRSAAKLVRPGGLLAYAVCSPTREEGPEVASAFSAEHADFSYVTQPLSSVLPAPDSDGVLRIGPWLTKGFADSEESSAPDAYQLVVWRRFG